MLKKRETVGALAVKAASDSTKYDLIELSHALTDDLARELMVCAHRHRQIFDEDEYCVGYVIASDPLIKGVMRRKFFAYLYLPSPRPDQCIFLYNKKQDRFVKRLWTLPNYITMAELSESTIVDHKYKEMKGWCDAFYSFKFWPYIRKQHGIKMLSESEYLNANREKLIKAGCKEVKPSATEAFDFGKITTNKVVNSNKTLFKQ